MAKPPPYPPKDKSVMRGTRKPSPKKNLMPMVGKLRDIKVDPMDYVRPPKRRGPAPKAPKAPKRPDGGRITPPKTPNRTYGGRITAPKPFTGSGGKFPSKIIKPYKGPKINRDDDLRDMFPKKKRTPTKPRGNPNAKYRIVPARKKK